MNNNDKRLVWYVCYGSNLCYERFMKYINKCKDKTPPLDSRITTIPYEMYFGNQSPRWNNGGVCFIKNTRDDSIKTIARAYLITYEQFLDIQEQEGNSNGWYGNKIELDPIDGREAYTFTSKYDHKFNPPDIEYVNRVTQGLIECGLSKKDAEAYLRKKNIVVIPTSEITWVCICLPDGSLVDLPVLVNDTPASCVTRFVDKWRENNGLTPQSKLGKCPKCGKQLVYQKEESGNFIIKCEECGYSEPAVVVKEKNEHEL